MERGKTDIAGNNTFRREKMKLRNRNANQKQNKHEVRKRKQIMKTKNTKEISQLENVKGKQEKNGESENYYKDK